MAMNKKKTTTAIVAGVTAAALLLGGTFAWTSISQRALNEAAGIVNVGGRLHDDFNGTNKDIYVENFTDPLNGGQPIYARVKLTEYMEVGKEAGKLNEEGTAFDESRNAQSVVAGATIDDVDSWSVHKPITDCTQCNEEDGTLCKFHEHWKWEMGGKTTYMPTFNKDKDSLTADINGTYGGTNKTDKVYYDDYVVYTTEDTGAQGVAFAEKEQTEGSIYSVIGTEYYDDDTNTAENTSEGQYRIEENKTHTAKETVEGTVILMKDWNGEAGNYWVYDEDGWAYWANPIMPGESTGLLLDGIEMYKNPGEKCYYSINVVGQFSTINDWDQFYTDENTKTPDVSENAQKVLSAAANAVPTMELVINNGEPNVIDFIWYENVPLKAVISVAGKPLESSEVGTTHWRLNGEYSSSLNSATSLNGSNTLTMWYDPAGTMITVIVESEKYPGLVATKTVRNLGDFTQTFLFDGKPFSETKIEKGKSYTVTLDLDDGKGLLKDATVVFDNFDVMIGNYDKIEDAKTTFDKDTGVLTIGDDIQAEQFFYFSCSVKAPGVNLSGVNSGPTLKITADQLVTE